MRTKVFPVLLFVYLPLITVNIGISGNITEPTKENVHEEVRDEFIEKDTPISSKPDIQKTTLQNLKTILQEVTTNLKGENGQWSFTFEEVSMAMLTNEKHDRMRVIAPVLEVDNLKIEHYQKMLEANFHTALDTRYAISGGIVYSTFIHPLSPLRDTQFASALMQVANLAKTFGSTYSSRELNYLRTSVEP